MVTTAIFPSRYVQGKGALTTHLPQELASLGHKALILQDPVVYERYQDTLASALHGVVDFEISIANAAMRRSPEFLHVRSKSGRMLLWVWAVEKH